ncbi:MAG: hypothetical protein HY062_11945 [Bacteroidetes bacterium]|nr:hypothetical protein [Bacteroidota bacterium]
MKKNIIHLGLMALLFTTAIYACKKKDNSSTDTSNNTSTGSNTTTGGGTTTGGTTTGGPSNTMTVSTGTAITTQTLVNFGIVNVTYPSNANSFNANTNPNYYAVQSVVPGTSTLTTGTYSASGSPTILGGTLGNLQATINSGIGGLTMGTYIGGNGTFTASAYNNKQRIQYSNVTFSLMTGTGTLSTTYTANISADYVQP